MPAASPLSTRLRAVAVASCLALVAVACGDDDDTSTAAGDDTAAPAEGETVSAVAQAYCELAAELDSQDGPPTVEQVEALRAAAPEEISEEIDVVADAFIAADGDFGKVFSDPAVQENFGAIEEFEATACGLGEGEEGGPGEPDTEAAAGAELVPVTAVDFAFEGLPDQVPSGPVAFEMTNEGDAAHEMMIFALGEGVDLDELLASGTEPTEDQARQVGGTFAPPGGSAFANVELEPGDYAAVCFIPGPEGKAHYQLGMKATFTVA